MSYSTSAKKAQVQRASNGMYRTSLGNMMFGSYSSQSNKMSAQDVKDSPLSPTVLADEIFNVDDDYDDYEAPDREAFDACGDQLTEEYEGEQFELELESVEDVRNRMEHTMQKFDRAYKKMAIYAMRWHFLMEDCKGDEQIAKMVRDLQVYRKLSGTGDPI